jgi:hypothetical protein
LYSPENGSPLVVLLVLIVFLMPKVKPQYRLNAVYAIGIYRVTHLIHKKRIENRKHHISKDGLQYQ